MWIEHRLGRLTASKAKSLYTLQDSTNPDRLIADIMGFTPPLSANISAIKWGRTHEEDARQAYMPKCRNSCIQTLRFFQSDCSCILQNHGWVPPLMVKCDAIVVGVALSKSNAPTVFVKALSPKQ